MNLIDEENLALCEAREKWDDVGLFLYGRTTCVLDRRSHLMGDDRGYCRLSESRWSIEEDMFKRLLADLRWSDRDSEVCLDLCLSDVFIESARTQWYLGDTILFECSRSDCSIDVRSRGLDSHEKEYIENLPWGKGKIQNKNKRSQINIDKICIMV